MPRFIPVTAAFIGLLSGCANIPDLGVIPVVAGTDSLESHATLAGTQSQWPTDNWWHELGDAQLDALIAEGLAGSPDVAIATARAQAADAMARQASANLRPQAGAEGSAGGVQQSQNLGIPPQFVPDGVRDTGHAAGIFSFDLDLWGKNRAALAAATSESQAAAVDAAQARLMLTTAIAAAYTDLAGQYDALDVSKEAQRIRNASAQLLDDRTRVGLDDRASASQAESRAAAARGDIVAAEEAISLTCNRIAALIGAGPDRGLTITRPQLRAPAVGLPAEAGIALIGRRPDIVAARLRAEAAAKRIDVVRADFYPNINLVALVGFQSLGFGNMFKSGSKYGNGGAAISLPIFDGGALDGRYRGARADYDIAVATYDQTLVGALHNVANIVASRAATERQLGERRNALRAASEAAKLAGLRYRAGLSNQLVQLTAEDSMIALSLTVADLEARKRSLDIALIRSLGGGYRDSTVAGE